MEKLSFLFGCLDVCASGHWGFVSLLVPHVDVMKQQNKTTTVNEIVVLKPLDFTIIFRFVVVYFKFSPDSIVNLFLVVSVTPYTHDVVFTKPFQCSLTHSDLIKTVYLMGYCEGTFKQEINFPLLNKSMFLLQEEKEKRQISLLA